MPVIVQGDSWTSVSEHARVAFPGPREAIRGLLVEDLYILLPAPSDLPMAVNSVNLRRGEGADYPFRVLHPPGIDVLSVEPSSFGIGATQLRYFGTDGIRGPWGSETLNPSIARGLARALRERFGSSVPIVRDTRESGMAILSALSTGLGADAVDHGVLPTPALSAILEFTGLRLDWRLRPLTTRGRTTASRFLGRGQKLAPEIEERPWMPTLTGAWRLGHRRKCML